MNPGAVMEKISVANIKIQSLLRTMAQFQDENDGFVDSWTFDALLTKLDFKCKDIIELVDGGYMEPSCLTFIGGEYDWVLTEKGHNSFC